MIGKNELVSRMLSILVTRAGGRVEVTPRELADHGETDSYLTIETDTGRDVFIIQSRPAPWSTLGNTRKAADLVKRAAAFGEMVRVVSDERRMSKLPEPDREALAQKVMDVLSGLQGGPGA